MVFVFVYFIFIVVNFCSSFVLDILEEVIPNQSLTSVCSLARQQLPSPSNAGQRS